MWVRPGPSPNSTQLTPGRIHGGIISGDLIFLEPAPKMSTQMWSTTHNTAQGTWSNPHMMTTAFQKQHCIFLKYDVSHLWCIHTECLNVRSGPKFVNKLFQANQEDEVFLKSCFALVTSTDWQHSSMCFFFLKYRNCAASQLINHVGFFPKEVQEGTGSTCRVAGLSKANNFFLKNSEKHYLNLHLFIEIIWTEFIYSISSKNQLPKQINDCLSMGMWN